MRTAAAQLALAQAHGPPDARKPSSRSLPRLGLHTEDGMRPSSHSLDPQERLDRRQVGQVGRADLDQAELLDDEEVGDGKARRDEALVRRERGEGGERVGEGCRAREGRGDRDGAGAQDGRGRARRGRGRGREGGAREGKAGRSSRGVRDGRTAGRRGTAAERRAVGRRRVGRNEGRRRSASPRLVQFDVVAGVYRRPCRREDRQRALDKAREERKRAHLAWSATRGPAWRGPRASWPRACAVPPR